MVEVAWGSSRIGPAQCSSGHAGLLQGVVIFCTQTSSSSSSSSLMDWYRYVSLLAHTTTRLLLLSLPQSRFELN